MSKYRKGVAYLRHLKPTDTGNTLVLKMRIAYMSDKSIWKHPERIKPVVLVQHGVKGVAAIFMNKQDALRSMFDLTPGRKRNAKHHHRRGLRKTQSDHRKAFLRWRFKVSDGAAK